MPRNLPQSLTHFRRAALLELSSTAKRTTLDQFRSCEN